MAGWHIGRLCVSAYCRHCVSVWVAYVVQVRYCLHVQQRLLKEQWPIKLAEHQMARTVSIGDLEGSGAGGQVLFNGLRVRMAINTGTACLLRSRYLTQLAGNLQHVYALANSPKSHAWAQCAAQVWRMPICCQSWRTSTYHSIAREQSSMHNLFGHVSLVTCACCGAVLL